MTTLVEYIETLTSTVLTGHHGLDEALAALENWLDTHLSALSDAERQAFSQSLEQETTNSNHSLVDSILKLHAARLLHRYDLRHAPDPAPDEAANEYVRARGAFEQALRHVEKPCRVAVMGCVVNGPGEAADADIAVCAAKEKAYLYLHGQRIATVPEPEIIPRLLEAIDNL